MAFWSGFTVITTTSGTTYLVGLDDGDNVQISVASLFTSPAFTGTPTAPTAAGGTNTTQLATTAFVTSAVATAVTGLLDWKGDTDCSGNPNYPAASKGDAYIVTVAGKIGGASGKSVDVGDVYVASADNAGGAEGSVGTSWFVLEHNLAGALLAANNLSDLANAATARANLGLGTGDSPQFTAINLGHASDTTIVRVSAGDISVEGNLIYRAGGTDVPVTDGGTGASTASGAATNLGLGTGDSPQFTAVNIGHASDTTVIRVSAGRISVEGVELLRSTITGPTVTFAETDNGNSGTSKTIDWTAGNKQKLTLTGNCTLTFTAPAGPTNLVLRLIQDGTGSRTVTWPAAVHWSGGTTPTLTTTASKVDLITLYYDGTTYFGCSSLNYTA